jgi:hypothetical protein
MKPEFYIKITQEAADRYLLEALVDEILTILLASHKDLFESLLPYQRKVYPYSNIGKLHTESGIFFEKNW